MRFAPFGFCAALAGWLPASALAATSVAPPPPPYAGVYQPQGEEEMGIWREDDEDERKLADSPLLIRDEALTAYVKKVLCSAVGEDRCKAARVYILRNPAFNATMTSNGTMRVFSGLLLRVRSESELASVLGHEFGHFEKRHGLARSKAHRHATDLLAWAALLATTANTRAAYTDYANLSYSVYGRLYRFTRAEEKEADLVGLGYLNASRLKPQAAARVWRHLILEEENSATSRGLKKPDFDRHAYNATHPAEGYRAAYLEALAAPDGPGHDEGSAPYKAALAKWIETFLDDQIKLNDFGGSEYLIQMLAEDGWTAPLWQARGELYRARGAPRDLANAADFYAKAIALDPGLAPAYRGLGLSLIKTGHPTEGSAALAKYLELKPDASDGSMIRTTLASVAGKS